MTVFVCCLVRLFPYILFKKNYVYILALEMPSPGNQHCASCFGTISFPMCLELFVSAVCSAVVCHQAAKLIAALLRLAGVTAGLAESNGSLPPGL